MSKLDNTKILLHSFFSSSFLLLIKLGQFISNMLRLNCRLLEELQPIRMIVKNKFISKRERNLKDQSRPQNIVRT